MLDLRVDRTGVVGFASELHGLHGAHSDALCPSDVVSQPVAHEDGLARIGAQACERFVEDPKRKALIAEVRKKIDELGIEYLYLQFVSVTGRIMGKGIPADHWESVADRKSVV